MLLPSAPGIEGQLIQMPLQMGQHVLVGAELAQIIQPDQLKAQLQIPETQAHDVLNGQPAEIDTHNGVVAGTVTRINPAVVNGTVTVDVQLDGTLPQGARPDLSVDGTIDLQRLHDVLHVGRPAFGNENSTISLFKLDPSGNYATRVAGQSRTCVRERNSNPERLERRGHRDPFRHVALRTM